MPWTAASFRSKHNKSLNDSQAKRAARTANSVYDRCIKNGGSDKTCAPRAIRIANAAVRGTKMDQSLSIFSMNGSPTAQKLDADRYRIEPIYEGVWIHPSTNQIVPVDRERLQGWANVFARCAERKVGVPLTDGHDLKASNTLGWVEEVGVFDRPDGTAALYCNVKVTDSEANRKIQEGSIQYVSPGIDIIKSSSDAADLEDLGEGFNHVAATPVPVIRGQPGFVKLSRDGVEIKIPILEPVDDETAEKMVALDAGPAKFAGIKARMAVEVGEMGKKLRERMGAAKLRELVSIFSNCLYECTYEMPGDDEDPREKIKGLTDEFVDLLGKNRMTMALEPEPSVSITAGTVISDGSGPGWTQASATSNVDSTGTICVRIDNTKEEVRAGNV